MAQQPFLPHPPPISSQSHPPWGFLLVLSLFFNALCVVIIGKHSQLLNRGSDLENLQSLGWSKKAAEEAEAAAKYSCSGHGYVFLDTFRRNQDGNPLCECNECYRGLDCSEIDLDCVANADRWAIVKDYDLYQKMSSYIEYNTIGVSHDTQLRATTLLKAILSGYEQSKGVKALKTDSEKLLFHYAYPVMRRRWEKLETIFGESDRFSLQNLQPLYCNFFGKFTDPSPANAWVKCEEEEEEEGGLECGKVLEEAGIIGRRAEEFGADKKYVRLSLVRRGDAFAVLERRLQALVSSNNSAQESM